MANYRLELKLLHKNDWYNVDKMVSLQNIKQIPSHLKVAYFYPWMGKIL